MGFVEIFILFQMYKNGENWLTFDKVIADYVMSCFYGSQWYLKHFLT